MFLLKQGASLFENQNYKGFYPAHMLFLNSYKLDLGFKTYLLLDLKDSKVKKNKEDLKRLLFHQDRAIFEVKDHQKRTPGELENRASLEEIF